MKKSIKYIFIFFLSIHLSGCWGIQESYDYKPDNVDQHTNMSAWEFIESRPDVFSLYKEAIEYVDESYPGFKDYFTKKETLYTYLILNNTAFTSESTTAPGLYMKYGIRTPSTATVRSINVDDMKKILSYSIIKGCYHAIDVSGAIGFEPMNVISVWESQEAEITLCMNEGRTTSFSALVVNRGVPNHPEVIARNCNYLLTNGAAHVFNAQYFYP